MYGLDFDSPVKDADIEMMELTAAAKRDAALIRAGKCPHSWTGPLMDSPSGEFTCYHCGHIWPNMSERDKEC